MCTCRCEALIDKTPTVTAHDQVAYSGADLYTVPLTEVSHAGGGRLGGRGGSAIVDSGTSSIEPYP